MAFLETPRFPDDIANGASGGPGFSTSIVVAASGRESRAGAWAYPRHAWDVSQGIRTQAQFDALLAFFMVAKGRLNGWRFKDWSDYAATHGNGRVAGLSGTTFQLVKRYTSGSSTLDRRIRKPIASGFQLKDGSTTLVLTTDYTLNATTGVVTTTTTRTAANLSWAGEFDVPMRFDTDRLERRLLARHPTQGLLHEWGSIPIVEDPSA
jgi:uncharacterized protein (TIGR02217 family)